MNATEAVAVLRDAIEKHRDPEWECNSDHPALLAALDATAAIAPPVAAGSVDTEAMRKIALAATPGPWMAWGEVAHEIYPSPSGSLIARAIKAKDMDFIAAANPVAVLDLIERAEKAEAELAESAAFQVELQEKFDKQEAAFWATSLKLQEAESRLKELEVGRQALQAEGKHPAPCARHCEANAFQIEVRRLEAIELDMHRKLAAETLRADQGWAHYEAANRAKNDLEREKVAPSCDCHSCQPITMENNRMILCAMCGNKRCPHANDHRNACTGSNEPGQPGSAYGPPNEVQHHLV